MAFRRHWQPWVGALAMLIVWTVLFAIPKLWLSRWYISYFLQYHQPPPWVPDEPSWLWYGAIGIIGGAWCGGSVFVAWLVFYQFLVPTVRPYLRRLREQEQPAH